MAYTQQLRIFVAMNIVPTLQEMPARSRVWIYQSNRPFSDEEVAWIRNQVNTFAESWAAHEHKLAAAGDVVHNRFIVLMVDESIYNASGCSIDKSVKVIQHVEMHLGVNMFDRLLVYYQDGTEIRSFHLHELESLFARDILKAGTLVFNNLVATKAEWEQNWLQPLSDTWLGLRIPSLS